METEMLTHKSMNSQSKNDGLYEKNLKNWVKKEKVAVALKNIIESLWLEKSVELVMFKKDMAGVLTSEILSLHLYARDILGNDLSIFETLRLAQGIEKLDLAPSRIDLGKLGIQWQNEKSNYNSSDDFIVDKLVDFIGSHKWKITPKDVVLYGFGRIGRLAARMLVEQTASGEQLRLRAIVTRSNTDNDIIKRADLLRTDSIHGHFKGTIEVDLENKAIIANGNTINMIAANNPGEIDYKQYGIQEALIIDNTGVYRNRKELGLHLKANGVKQVLLTAPGKDDIPNIVYGVNHKNIDINKENIYSAASCTTNAIVPVLSVIQNCYGVEKGHIETIHAYTNDQNLLDNYHKKYRRGRAAALNMVITETGAAKAVVKVIPELINKLTANAVRVPTPDGSLAVLMLTLNKKTTVEEINKTLKNAALSGELVEQIRFSFSNELVSSDIIGTPRASIFDSQATQVSVDGKNVVLYVWYDNEFGYTFQVMKIARYICDVVRLRYY